MADEDDDFDAEEELEADADQDGDEDLGDDLGEDIDDEELDGATDLVEEGAVDDADDDDDDEEASQETPARATRTNVRKKRKETESLHTVAAREDVRKQLANDVEAFLKRGGSIQNVPLDERTDSSKKTGGTYGRGST